METVTFPFKKLEEVLVKDQPFRTGELSGYHAILSEFVLNSSVPAEIHQIFDTARNLSLYGFYATHFHQVAMLYSFIALESALKLKAEKEEVIWHEENRGKYGPDFSKLLRLAKKRKWLVNERFSFFERLVYVNAKNKKMFKNLKEGVVPEPTNKEIDAARKTTDIVSAILTHSNGLRNAIAHGSAIMDPAGSHGCLRQISEAINQLFPENSL